MSSTDLIEAMARAMCAAQGLDWKDQFSIYSSNGDPLAHEAYMHDADAALSALRQWMEDEGLVCVPKQGTPAMWQAAQMNSEVGQYVCSNWAEAYDCIEQLYRVMISAVPDALETKP
jgi:hypothetical protein